MHYSELIQFETLETVIEIRDANQAAKAQKLVSTYVISNEMAYRLINLVFVHLQFDNLNDNKGLLIIGHYGTGKSHLMATISGIAENAELVSHLNHPQVAQAASAIAGKFYVLRTEIGATTRSLRDILTQELETYLNQLGIHFQFPTADTITNNKVAFENMMASFQTHYPKHGLLLVIDELLDYLRTRKDQELILDLSFLREIGEVCKNLRFRFIAGLQETIFDNQRFEFVAHSLRRVKDRFEQLLITRQDLKFVVAERLLKKNAQQQAQIRQYLTPFAPCYDHMNERMTEFVSLFPVHPDYIDTFERITVIEKREILKTLESAVQALAKTLVPTDYPGLISYDCYWETLRENPSFRAIPEIREVIECSQVLENRLEQAFTRPAYQPIARRIIHALSVHRLTTHNLDAPVGVTASELRDSLCLYFAGIDELGGHPADDLLSLVETVLQEILKTVNKQFISTNPENGQYYLDFKKSYDYDAIIEKRVESLDIHQLNRYYYAALRQLMEISDQPLIGAQNLSWSYELEWRSHKVTRQGYLIFGAPNRTTTALSVTHDSFLLYFLPLYSEFSDQLPVISTAKEVFFRLTKTDDIFNQALRFYTAAADLTSTASGHAKFVYESKAQTYLREIVQWLQEHKPTAFEVSYQDRTQMLLEWLEQVTHEELCTKSDPTLFAPHPSLLDNFRDLIDLVADICLETYFYQLAPEYPKFTTLVSYDNLTQAAQEALRGIISLQRGKLAQGILAALELLDEQQRLDPSQSKYAQALLKQLHQKPAGQVLNQVELLSENYFSPANYRLEPELVMILIAALVSAGELVLVMPKQQFDVTNVTALAYTPIRELLTFKHLERPKNLNLAALAALFELLALPSSLEAALVKNDSVAVQQFQAKISEILEQLVQTQQILAKNFIFWGKPLLSEAETQVYRDRLAQSKTFLESLQVYSNSLTFKNFRYSTEEVIEQREGFQNWQEVTHLITILKDNGSKLNYLTAAEATLPSQSQWLIEMNQVRDQLLSQLNDVEQRHRTGFSYYIQQQLNTLQRTYIKTYINLHQQARLNAEGERTKQGILNDRRLFNLKQLSKINLLPTQQLHDFENRLTQLPTCYALSENDLKVQTVCPHCGYKPSVEFISFPTSPSSATVTVVEQEINQLNLFLEQLYADWTQILLTELENAENRHELLKTAYRDQLNNFLQHRVLPDEVTPAFVEAVQEGLAGLIKVTVNLEDLQDALRAGGSPVTVMEMQRRFEDYLRQLILNQEVSQIRILLK